MDAHGYGQSKMLTTQTSPNDAKRMQVDQMMIVTSE